MGHMAPQQGWKQETLPWLRHGMAPCRIPQHCGRKPHFLSFCWRHGASRWHSGQDMTEPLTLSLFAAFSHSSGGHMSEIKVPAGVCSVRGSTGGSGPCLSSASWCSPPSWASSGFINTSLQSPPLPVSVYLLSFSKVLSQHGLRGQQLKLSTASLAWIHL